MGCDRVRKRVKKGQSKEAVEAREMRFAEVYMANGENGTRAHMEVFGTTNEANAAAEASKLIRKPKVSAYIQKRRAELLAQYSLRPDLLYREVGRLSYFDPRKLVDAEGKPKKLHEIDADTAAAIAALEMEVLQDGRVTYRVRTHDKNSAIDKALKLTRLYDAPPPPPPDDQAHPSDPRDTARRMAFLLRRGAQKKLEGPT